MKVNVKLRKQSLSMKKDLSAFKRLIEKGVTCTVQNTPDQTPVDVLTLASA